jgi:hypothetical protein
VTFYDDLADSYHLIYPDWGREVRRQGEVLDRLIRAQMGSEPLSILDCSAGIGTQADDELLLAAQNILSKLREDCLFLASIRDYDQILRERPSATMPSLSDSPGGKRVYFQVWEWADDGRTYTIHLFLVTGSGGRWEVQHHHNTVQGRLAGGTHRNSARRGPSGRSLAHARYQRLLSAPRHGPQEVKNNAGEGSLSRRPSGLYAAGPWSATYDGGRRIDYMLYRGAMGSLSDHLLVRVEPEV